MARKFRWSIEAHFRDYASRKIRSLGRAVQKIQRGWAGGLFGGMAGAARGARPGGVGGMFAGVTQGAAKLVALPARIIGAFAGLIPGVGRIISGVVGTATNLLTGLVGMAANVVGGMINAFGRLVAGVASAVGRAVSVAAGILGRLVKVGAGIGLGVGAVVGWQFVKGLRENMKLADIRQVLKKLLGPLAKDAEEYAIQLSLASAFTPMEVLKATAGIAAVSKEYRKYLGNIVDWAAGSGQKLEEAIGTFQRARSGQKGEAMEGMRRGLISRADMEAAGAKFGGGGQFLGTNLEFVEAMMRAIEARFKGMAATAAEVGSGPWSTFVGAVQALRMTLTEPWYEEFNQSLKEMNAWLLKVGAGSRWEGLIGWSERAAVAVREKLGGALEWVTTRKWSFDNFRSAALDVLGEIKGAILGLPALLPDVLAIVVAGVKVLAAQVRGVLKVLWVNIGADLAAQISLSIAGVGSAILRAVVARQESRAARAARVKELTAGISSEKEIRKRLHGISPGPSIAEKAVTAAAEATATGLANLLVELGSAGAMQRPEREKERLNAEAAAQADRDVAAAARDLVPPLAALGEWVTGLLGGFKGAAAGALPAKTPAQRGDERAQAQRTLVDSIRAKVAARPDVQSMERRRNELQRTLETFQKAGMSGAASGLRARIKALEERILLQNHEFAMGILGDMVDKEKRLKEVESGMRWLKRAVRQMSMART